VVKLRPELIIAEKEFKENMASKRFLAIFAILLLLSLYGVYTGMDNYNNKLDNYKNSIAVLKNQLNTSPGPVMPSILEVFSGMIILLSFLGMIMGASLGFDQISKERDEGSLKFLVASPIYRDAIINGKTIGAIVTLTVALASAFIIAIAIVMFKGVVPGLDDIVRIIAFFISALIYCMVFFAIAMMMSTVTRSTSTSVICVVGIVVVLILFSAVLSIMISGFIATSIVGPAPPMYYGSSTENTFGAVNTSSEYNNYTNKLVSTELQVSDTISAISPVGDFGGITGLGYGGIGDAILTKYQVQITGSNLTPSFKEVSLLDSLSSIWALILVLIVEILVAFAISYSLFIRMDIR
jgi:ABC-2 type transport system permease protein